VGAVAWPYLSGWRGERTALLALAAALVLGGAALVGSARGAASVPLRATDVEPARGDVRLSRRRMLIVFSPLFFLYVGTESAVGGWAAALAQRTGAGQEAEWRLVPSLFYGMLLLGRALAPVLLLRVPDASLALGGVVLAGIATAILLGAETLPGVRVGVALCGLGLASVFPIIIALMTRSFGSSASRVAGWMFGLAGLGGAALPWLVGIASTALGILRAGLAVPFLASWVMAALLVEARRACGTRTARSASTMPPPT
jgi:fucose permease